MGYLLDVVDRGAKIRFNRGVSQVVKLMDPFRPGKFRSLAPGRDAPSYVLLGINSEIRALLTRFACHKASCK